MLKLLHASEMLKKEEILYLQGDGAVLTQPETDKQGDVRVVDMTSESKRLYQTYGNLGAEELDLCQSVEINTILFLKALKEDLLEKYTNKKGSELENNRNMNRILLLDKIIAREEAQSHALTFTEQSVDEFISGVNKQISEFKDTFLHLGDNLPSTCATWAKDFFHQEVEPKLNQIIFAMNPVDFTELHEISQALSQCFLFYQHTFSHFIASQEFSDLQHEADKQIIELRGLLNDSNNTSERWVIWEKDFYEQFFTELNQIITEKKTPDSKKLEEMNSSLMARFAAYRQAYSECMVNINQQLSEFKRAGLESNNIPIALRDWAKVFFVQKALPEVERLIENMTFDDCIQLQQSKNMDNYFVSYQVFSEFITAVDRQFIAFKEQFLSSSAIPTGWERWAAEFFDNEIAPNLAREVTSTNPVYEEQFQDLKSILDLSFALYQHAFSEYLSVHQFLNSYEGLIRVGWTNSEKDYQNLHWINYCRSQLNDSSVNFIERVAVIKPHVFSTYQRNNSTPTDQAEEVRVVTDADQTLEDRRRTMSQFKSEIPIDSDELKGTRNNP